MNNNLFVVEEVQKFIVTVAALPACDHKIKVMEVLLDLEWNLRKALDDQEKVLSDDALIGREEPWSE